MHPSKSRRGGIKRSEREHSDEKPSLIPAPSSNSKRPRLESVPDLDLSDDDDISGGNIDSAPTSMFDVNKLCAEFDGLLADDTAVQDLVDIFDDCAYELEYNAENDKPTRKQHVYSEKDLRTSFERDIIRMVKEANEQKVICSGFNFAMATGPREAITWQSRAHPARMVSLWYTTFRDFYTILTSHLIRYGERAPLSVGKGADGKKRNAASAYVFREGEVSGCSILTRLWHAVGRTIADNEPTISISFLKTGAQFNNATTLVDHLRLLSVRVNQLLKSIDPH
ncbi:hypothetical protein BDZ89DRAFT_1055502, partial [Hymenopellis radicata]